MHENRVGQAPVPGAREPGLWAVLSLCLLFSIWLVSGQLLITFSGNQTKVPMCQGLGPHASVH